MQVSAVGTVTSRSAIPVHHAHRVSFAREVLQGMHGSVENPDGVITLGCTNIPS